jgi:hypothetical protein
MRKINFLLFLLIAPLLISAQKTYTNVDTINEHYIISKERNQKNYRTKYGIIDYNGEIVFKYKYSYINIISEQNHLRTSKKRYKPLFFRVDGKNIIELDNIIVSENAIKEKLKKKWRIIFLKKPEKTTDYIYDEISNYGYEKGYKVKIDKKWGVISNSGDIKLKCEYDYIKIATQYNYPNPTSHFFILTKNDQDALYNSNFEEIIPFGDYSLYKPSVNRILFYDRDKSLYGYFDTLGNIAIKPEYADAEYFPTSKMTAVSKEGDSYYFIDIKGDKISKDYDFIELDSETEEYFIVYNNGVAGALSSYYDYDTLVPFKYSKIYTDFYYGMIIIAEDFNNQKTLYDFNGISTKTTYDEIELNDDFGYILIETEKNKKEGILIYNEVSFFELIPCFCDYTDVLIEEINDDVAIECSRNGKLSFYDPYKSGKLLEGEFDDYEYLQEYSWVMFYTNGKVGLYNIYDQIWVIKPEYSHIEIDFDLFDNYGIIPVYDDNKLSFYNIYNDTFLYQNVFNDYYMYDYSEYIAVIKDNKVGILKVFQPYIPPVFDAIYSLNYGYTDNIASVKKDGVKGYAFLKEIPDTSLKEPIFVEDFENLEDFFQIQQNGKWGIMDYWMQIIVPCEFDNIIYNFDTEFIVEKDGKFGMYNYEGKIPVPIEYEELVFGDGIYIFAKKNGLWGMIDKNNKIITEFKYNKLKDLMNEI